MKEPIAYLNGKYLPLASAHVGVEDRGLQFGDSVYEVILVANHRLVDNEQHIERLGRSMAEMEFDRTPNLSNLQTVLSSLIAKNKVRDGFVYVQVTRGQWPRNMSSRSGPEVSAPTVIAYARHLKLPLSFEDQKAINVTALPDTRWLRCDIKTTALAGSTLARIRSNRDGFDDAWLIDRNSEVTEATAANTWIIRNGILQTRPVGRNILAGITRRRLLLLAREIGIGVKEAAFTVAEVKEAEEAFQTSATALVTPIARFDDREFGSHANWQVTREIFGAYMAFARY